MRTDFDKQWERRKAWRAVCPLDDAELERRVRLAQESGERREENGKRTSFPLSAIRWSVPVAACLLVAVLLPPKIKAQPQNDIERVDVDGRQIYFVCNCGCSAVETMDYLNTLIR